MVTSTLHGDGSVTYSNSPGQTGGSGYTSGGPTYNPTTNKVEPTSTPALGSTSTLHGDGTVTYANAPGQTGGAGYIPGGPTYDPGTNKVLPGINEQVSVPKPVLVATPVPVLETPSSIKPSIDPNLRIPSVGGYTSFISPSGEHFDAPTSQYANILSAGGKVAPFVPSRDRPNVVWETPEQFELKRTILENPNTVYASSKFYEEEYSETSSFGSIKPQSSVYVSSPEPYVSPTFGKITPVAGLAPYVPSKDIRINPLSSQQTSINPYDIGKYDLPLNVGLTENQKILAGTRGQKFAVSAIQWGERQRSGIDALEARSKRPGHISAYSSTVMKAGVDTAVFGGVALGVIGSGIEKPVEFAREAPGVISKSAYNLPKDIIATGSGLFIEPYEKRGLLGGTVAAATNVASLAVLSRGMDKIGRPVTFASRTVVRSGLDLVKETPRGFRTLLADESAELLVKRKRKGPETKLKHRESEVKPETEVIDASKAEPMKSSVYVETPRSGYESGNAYAFYEKWKSWQKAELSKPVDARVVTKAELSKSISAREIIKGTTFSEYASITAGLAAKQRQEMKQNAFGLTLQKSVSIQRTAQRQDTKQLSKMRAVSLQVPRAMSIQATSSSSLQGQRAFNVQTPRLVNPRVGKPVNPIFDVPVPTRYTRTPTSTPPRLPQ